MVLRLLIKYKGATTSQSAGITLSKNTVWHKSEKKQNNNNKNYLQRWAYKHVTHIKAKNGSNLCRTRRENDRAMIAQTL